MKRKLRYKEFWLGVFEWFVGVGVTGDIIRGRMPILFLLFSLPFLARGFYLLFLKTYGTKALTITEEKK